EIVAEIERTRQNLARTIDSLADRVSPASNVRRLRERAASEFSRPEVQVAVLAAALAATGFAVYRIWARRRGGRGKPRSSPAAVRRRTAVSCERLSGALANQVADSVEDALEPEGEFVLGRISPLEHTGRRESGDGRKPMRIGQPSKGARIVGHPSVGSQP